MTARMLKSPLRRRLQLVVLALVALLLILQLFMQSFFMNAMRTLYMNNVNSAITQVVGDLRALMNAQSNAVAHIVDDENVRDYASTVDSRARYQMAYGVVRPIVQGTLQNLPIDHLIIYDISNAWYQFVGALSFEDFRTLRSRFGGLRDPLNTAMVLDGKLLLCSAAPLLRADHAGHIWQDGLVVAMMDADTIHGALPGGEGLAHGTILLHNGETILLSNDASLEGRSLTEGPIASNKYFVSSDNVLSNLSVTVSIPRDQIFPEETPYLMALSIVAIFSLFALLITLQLATRWFSRPITKIMSEMRDITDEGRGLTHTGVDHMDTLVDGINDLLVRLEDSNRDIIRTQQTLYEAELERQQTQLMLLKKQINAHFLYNCLTGIKTLTDDGEAEKAGEMAQGVGLLMRYTHSAREEVNVFDEMSIIQRYIQIMNIRFGDKFHYTFDVDDELVGYRMRKLLLQPLVENALVHGLEKQTRACHLHVTGKREGGALVFTVEDTGIGIPPDKLAQIRASLASVAENYPYQLLKGISLINIQKRAHTAYGEGYGLTVESEPDAFTRVTLRIRAIPDTAPR
ncbi:histidine kinase [Eubacteriales bacterium OttesenSCG-928-A19]|nr:histidine kinase [Eubacteriales bacterium OttesenSCG-928-A19]